MYLITGSAGFIGFHICLKLLKKKNNVIGIDNLNNYYDVKLKKKRNKILKSFKNYKFYKINILNQREVNKVFKKNKIKTVIHLAAQAGVRYSIKFPEYNRINDKKNPPMVYKAHGECHHWLGGLSGWHEPWLPCRHAHRCRHR